MGQRTIMIVAGEASGDLHGGNLVREMRALDPALSFYGMGGRAMREAGVSVWADAADMAVVGLTEVFAKLGAILRVLGRLKRSLRRDRPDLVILIDYPDFNLPLARAAARAGIPVLYYISPQVWAWRRGRIRTIREAVRRMAVILPFEEAFYREAGVEVTFVGHPLLDQIGQRLSRPEALARFGLAEGVATVGLLPGSRHGEVTRLLPAMLEAGRILAERQGPLQFLLPLADTLEREFVEGFLRTSHLPVRVVAGAFADAVSLCDAAMVASGTATLETALLGTPMVVVYRVSAASYAIGRRFIRVDHISLANIIAGKRVVPELIQDEATPEGIAAAVGELLADPEKAQAMRAELARIRGRLGEPGAARRTAEIALGMLP